jgi:hypothetical protein
VIQKTFAGTLKGLGRAGLFPGRENLSELRKKDY